MKFKTVQIMERFKLFVLLGVLISAQKLDEDVNTIKENNIAWAGIVIASVLIAMSILFEMVLGC